MEHHDVIVIGAGIMGSAAAYHLARAGTRVLLLEQFALGHTKGSSHGHSRIIRLAYDLPEYVRLARAAYPLWHALEDETGIKLLHTVGGLDLGRPGEPSFAATHASVVAEGVPFELLDRAALAVRFPQFNLAEDMIGIYQEATAILDADHCVATLHDQARRAGARIADETTARRIIPHVDRVEVVTDAGSLRADRLIVTAGSWAGPLLQPLGLDLPLIITKEHVAFFTPRDPAPFQPGRFPIFIHHDSVGASGYGFPIFGLPGVKIGLHRSGAVVHPDDPDRSLDQRALARLHAYVATLLPGAAGPIMFAQSCRYTNTPDLHFIIDRHPAHPAILIGSPCSGHGFKFGILIGRILADLATCGTTSYPIDQFRLDRPFARAESRL